MRTVIILLFFVAQGCVPAPAQQTNKYSNKIVRFCKTHKGQDVGGKGCNDLIYKIFKKYNVIGEHRFSITDSTDHRNHEINIGDYAYFHLWKGEKGASIGCHYAVIIGVTDSTITIAHQNRFIGREREKGVGFSTINTKTASGEIEIYGYKKYTGKIREYSKISYENGRSVRTNHTPMRFCEK